MRFYHKIPKIGTHVNVLKWKTFNIAIMLPKDAIGTANSADPTQTAPTGAV